MATHLSQGDVEWCASWLELKASVEALDPARVDAAVKWWLQCANRVVSGGDEWNRPEDVAVWTELHHFMRLATYLTAMTQLPEPQGIAAANCTSRLTASWKSGFFNRV